jgi:hypothetical protein
MLSTALILFHDPPAALTCQAAAEGVPCHSVAEFLRRARGPRHRGHGQGQGRGGGRGRGRGAGLHSSTNCVCVCVWWMCRYVVGVSVCGGCAMSGKASRQASQQLKQDWKPGDEAPSGAVVTGMTRFRPCIDLLRGKASAQPHSRELS